MLQANGAAAGVPLDSAPPSIIQFFTIELAPTGDGKIFVGVTATICEREGDLENMDMASERVDSMDEALAAIREAVVTAIPS